MGMDMFLGIILFLVGTFAAFMVATAVIAYLRTFSVYAGIKRLYRISFNLGIITIAVLVSVILVQVLAPVFLAGALDETVAMGEAKQSESDLDTSAAGGDVEATDDDGGLADGAESEAGESLVNDTTTSVGDAGGQGAMELEPAVVIEPDEAEPVLVATANLGENGPNYKVWKNTRNGHEYVYTEIENGIPYVYMPNARGTFWYDLNNISAGREGGNIVLMANAGIYNMTSLEPLGMTIQNGKISFAGQEQDWSCWTLVVDEDGNVGYIHGVVKGEVASFIDARTGEMRKDKKIVSAVYAFVPFILNNDVASEEYAGIYGAYRARQIFCVKQDSYMLITNTGEGIDGGWNYNDMITVARRRGCISAFNLDGGGSTALAWRNSIGAPFTAYATTERYDPTFIVFTINNTAPSGK